MAVRYAVATVLVILGLTIWELREILIDVAGALSMFFLAGLVITWDR